MNIILAILVLWLIAAGAAVWLFSAINLVMDNSARLASKMMDDL